MSQLKNSEYPDEMLHNAAFHQGIHYLLLQEHSSAKYLLLCGNNDLWPSVYTIDYPRFEWLFLTVAWGCLWFVIMLFPGHTHFLFSIASNQKEDSIRA